MRWLHELPNPPYPSESPKNTESRLENTKQTGKIKTKQRIDQLAAGVDRQAQEAQVGHSKIWR